MKIEQIYTGCLAQGAYYIESDGEVAIIDPLREVSAYMERAEHAGAKIKYIFETHFHADFVSGHIDLSRLSGAPIVFGPTATPGFQATIAKDGEVFKIGKLSLMVLHTPGHTLESTCFLLRDENGKDHCIFTGDTLFLGDVGRPDLAQKSNEITQEDLAGMLYDSLMTKIMPLANELIVYPGHGAGSACGKNMMKETVDTLGHQKEMNYALRQASREDFIAAVTEGLTPPPGYFPMNVAMNKTGYNPLEEVLKKGMKALSPEEFLQVAELADPVILDTRPAARFALGHIPGSINIGLDGQFAPWVGALIVDVEQAILLVAEPGKEEEALTRLSRIGFDHVLGHLSGGFATWKDSGRAIDTVNRIDADTFAKEYAKGKKIVDVRKEGEFAAGHIEDAEFKSLDAINEWFHTINPEEHFYMHCAGGYRSMIAASILKSRGIHNFSEVAGGYNAIAKTSIPKTDFVCQSK